MTGRFSTPERIWCRRDLADELALPKFSITSRLGLGEALRGLGVTEPLDPDVADLSRMDGTRRLFVSNVVHQATIEVDQTGTTAAAATAVGIDLESRGPSVVVDKPFMVAIRDDATGALL